MLKVKLLLSMHSYELLLKLCVVPKEGRDVGILFTNMM